MVFSVFQWCPLKRAINGSLKFVLLQRRKSCLGAAKYKKKITKKYHESKIHA